MARRSVLIVNELGYEVRLLVALETNNFPKVAMQLSPQKESTP